MSDRVFVDANVLVYVRDATEPAKQEMAERWLRELWSGGNGRVSIQVLQEFYVTVTQKLRPGMRRAAAREDVKSLFSWQPVTQDRHLLDEAWALQDRFQLSWWDAPVIAAAVRTRCRYLLSEDFQDGMVFGDVMVIDPFERDHQSVLAVRGESPASHRDP